MLCPLIEDPFVVSSLLGCAFLLVTFAQHLDEGHLHHAVLEGLLVVRRRHRLLDCPGGFPAY